MSIEKIIKAGERENIEFKEKLSADYHLSREKMQKLAAQMRYRLEVGKGKAIYFVGVKDDGTYVGLSRYRFEETLSVLKAVSAEIGAEIISVKRFEVNGGLIGKIEIEKTSYKKQSIVVSTAGHVDSGKSTLIGTLISGIPDNGAGRTRLFLDVLPHEIERGLSAELSYAVLGFKNGKPLLMKNPLDKRERSRVVEESDKIVSFVDTVGHEPWLRTTIRGLLGQNIDYGILTVAVDSGITRITKEHLGVMLAVNIPVIICITKKDLVEKGRLEEIVIELERMLKYVGKIPLRIKTEKDIALILDKIDNVVPIITTSSLSMEGLELLTRLLQLLGPRKRKINSPFLMYIDKVYNIWGVGTVVSGTIKQGKIKRGEELFIGPDRKGEFRKVKATSIESHYCRFNEAEAGFMVGVALRGIKPKEVERGMVLFDKKLKDKIKPVKSFTAEILVLTHPTKISSGYEPVIHLNTFSQTAKIECIDKEYLKAGDIGKVKVTFKYRPYIVFPHEKFVFREGKTKGIGTVISLCN